jgi:hypothetical protein
MIRFCPWSVNESHMRGYPDMARNCLRAVASVDSRKAVRRREVSIPGKKCSFHIGERMYHPARLRQG